MPWKPPSAQHCHYDYRRTDKALANYRSADNRGLTIGRLPINTKSYKNLTFLPFEIEKSCYGRRCNRAGHYIFVLWFLLLSPSFFSSPNLSSRRLDIYHTSTHSVAQVQI